MSAAADIRRFMAKTQPAETGCWEWQGYRRAGGYGQYRGPAGRQSRLVAAHRFAYEAFVAPIPDGLSVMHRCDNPPCVNPAHLELGSQRDNMTDAARKGRMGGERSAWRLHPDLRRRPKTRVSRAVVNDILVRHEAGEGIASLAREFGLHVSTVSRYVGGSRRARGGVS